MKNITFNLILLFLITFNLQAQDISNHSIGLRLGDGDGFNTEISYQKAIGRVNRAELNLGFRDSREFDAFKVSGLYQWVHSIERNFNWYYGFGGGLGDVEFKNTPNNNTLDNNDGLFIFAAGNLGIEYNFDIPLLLSIDTRPEIGLIGFSGFDNRFILDVAIGLRYQF